MGLGLGFVLEGLLPGGSFPGGFAIVGGVVLGAAGVLVMWWLSSFRRAGTPVAPYEPTTALVTDGPYRLTRNPAYLAMALAYLAIALLADAPWVLAPLPLVLVVVDRGVIAREERYLERRFGADYASFKGRTRRWL